MRRTPLSIAITLLALAIVAVAGAIVLRPPADLATPSPSPTPASTPNATATATSGPAASPTASPSPQGLYVSKRLGYALVLSPPWRMASCPALDPTRTALPLVEHFTNVPVMDEELGHAGTPNDRIEVFIQANPQRLSPVDFARSNPLPGPLPAGSPAPESVTFAGRPAAQVSFPDFPFAYFLLIADGDRMFTIAARLSTSSPSPDLQAILSVVRTFRFATAAEVAAVPDPTPIAAGGTTPQALAGVLATAFQQKDIATLERLLSSCVSQGVQNGGGSAITRDRFIASLRTQFANGLTVTVDMSTVTVDGRFGPGVGTVRSRWSAQPPMGVGPAASPGQSTQNVALMLAPTAGGYYWLGTILLPPG
jgi:hypothetical protein